MTLTPDFIINSIWCAYHTIVCIGFIQLAEMARQIIMGEWAW